MAFAAPVLELWSGDNTTRLQWYENGQLKGTGYNAGRTDAGDSAVLKRFLLWNNRGNTATDLADVIDAMVSVVARQGNQFDMNSWNLTGGVANQSNPHPGWVHASDAVKTNPLDIYGTGNPIDGIFNTQNLRFITIGNQFDQELPGSVTQDPTSLAYTFNASTLDSVSGTMVGGWGILDRPSNPQTSVTPMTALLARSYIGGDEKVSINLSGYVKAIAQAGQNFLITLSNMPAGQDLKGMMFYITDGPAMEYGSVIQSHDPVGKTITVYPFVEMPVGAAVDPNDGSVSHYKIGIPEGMLSGRRNDGKAHYIPANVPTAQANLFTAAAMSPSSGIYGNQNNYSQLEVTVAIDVDADPGNIYWNTRVSYKHL